MQWTPESVAAKAKNKVLGIKKSAQAKLEVGCCKLTPMTLKSFWTAVEDSKHSGEYLYLNAQVHQLGKSFEADVGPVHFMDFAATPARPEMLNVWFGSKGSTAAIHHDPFENFFVQIYGRKRFYLFPPSESSGLYLFPKTHPKNRQSQVNLNAAADLEDIDRRFPDLRKARGIEVILNPGDVMYLPPYYFHQVEALDDAISVNEWFLSKDVVKMDEAWGIDLPLSAEMPPTKVAAVVKLTLVQLIDQVFGYEKDGLVYSDSSVELIKALVAERFAPLYGPFDFSTTARQEAGPVDLLKGIVTTEDPHLRVHLREQAEVDSTQFITTDQFRTLQAQDWEEICPRASLREYLDLRPTEAAKIRDYASSVAAHFKAVDAKELVRLHVLDFIEDLSGQTVGDANVLSYFLKCLLVN